MQDAPLPDNEKRRLAALEALDILDTPAEASFDSLTELASDLFQVPTTLISLVDINRQWFKSRQGLEAPELGRDESFCGHAVASGCMLVVEDTLADERFHDNPLVVGEPYIRFYAGAPLSLDGEHVLGTLCLIDYQPRPFTDRERHRLEQLGRQAVELLRVHQQRRRAEANQALSVLERERAERANQAKTQFLSSMSHELRTPLNAIMGYSQLLMTGKEPLSEKQARRIQQIHHSGEHLLYLIDDVLDMARIESGRMRTDIEAVSILQVVQDAVEGLELLARRHQIKIEVNAPGAENESVSADYTRLKQVLTNLISNGIKYNRRNGQVRISCEARDNRWRFCVADTGPGIPSDQLDGLFEPFNRLGAEAGNIEGTGIGLTLTRELVSLMNGELEFDTSSSGTRFWFELPQAQAATPDRNPDTRPQNG